MAVTAHSKLQYADIVTLTVKAASTATKGYGGQYDGTDETTVLDCTAGQRVDVIFLESATAGNKVQCVRVPSNGVVPVKVGTGGASAGLYAIMASDGFTNRTVGGGTTLREIAGKFTQTGVAADMVGLAIGPFAAVSS